MSDDIPESALQAARELLNKDDERDPRPEEIARAMDAYAQAQVAEAVRAEREIWRKHAIACCYSAATIAGLHSNKAYDAIVNWIEKPDARSMP